MKKIILSLLFCAALIPSVFAKAEDVEITAESEKVFGFGPGLRLSILGLEPTIAVDFYNLEVEGACAFSTGLDGKQFGAAPSFTISYNTNPFDKGGFATFGGEYMYLTRSYTNMLTKTIDENVKEDVLPGVHSLSFIYKGGYNFGKMFGILWRFRLPLLIYAEQDGESINLNVSNLPGCAACAFIGVCTTSIGIQFRF